MRGANLTICRHVCLPYSRTLTKQLNLSKLFIIRRSSVKKVFFYHTMLRKSTEAHKAIVIYRTEKNNCPLMGGSDIHEWTSFTVLTPPSCPTTTDSSGCWRGCITCTCKVQDRDILPAGKFCARKELSKHEWHGAVAPPPGESAILPSILHCCSDVTRSHGDQCCKGDASSQWEKANLPPLTTPTPLNRQSRNIAHVITFTIFPHMRHLAKIAQGLLFPI